MKNSSPLRDSDFGNVDVFYESYYSKMFSIRSKGPIAYLWKYPHKVIERDFRKSTVEAILEVGAGNGEHLQACNVNSEKYTMLDIKLPNLNGILDDHPQRIVQVVGDAEETGLEESSYNRIIATCVLAHLKNPEKALAEWRRLAKSEGYISIYIPCEPGISLRLLRKCLTARKARKLGYHGYELYISRDHINDAHRLLTFIKYYFQNDQIKYKYRPFHVKSWFLNMFIIAQVKVIK